MTADLRLRVVTDGDTRGLDQVDRALEVSAREMDRTGRQARQLGAAFEQAKRDAAQLDRELARNAAEVKLLAKEYASADKDVRESIKKRLDAERAAGNEIRRVRQDIVGDTEKDSKTAAAAFRAATNEFKKVAKQAGEDSASAFADGFRGLLKNPVILGIGASLAALLAIPVGAMVGGLALGAAGLGGAALAGLAGAKADHSGKVAAGGKDLAATLNAQLLSGGQDAVGPLLKGINELKKSANDVHLDRIIRDASRYIEPLAAGAGKFAASIGKGVDELVKHAGPEVQVLSDELPELGKAFEQAMSDIGGGSKGGAAGLKDLLDITEGVIVGTGKFIGGAEKAYGAIKHFGDGVTEVVDDLAPFSPATASAAFLLSVFGQNAEKTNAFAVKLGDSTDNLADTFGALDDKIKAVTLDLHGLVDNQLNARDAEIAFKDSLAGLKDEIDAHSRSVDLNSEAGRKNVSAFDELIKKAEEHRQAVLKQTGSLAAADAAYADDIAQIKKMGEKLHFTSGEMDTLIGLAEKIAAMGEIKLHVSAPGLASTLGMLGQLSHLSGQIGAVVVASAKAKHKAAGGPVNAGQPYLVGERGPELVVPSVNGTVMTAGQTSAMMRGGTASMPPATMFEQAFAWAVLRLRDQGLI